MIFAHAETPEQRRARIVQAIRVTRCPQCRAELERELVRGANPHAAAPAAESSKRDDLEDDR